MDHGIDQLFDSLDPVLEVANNLEWESLKSDSCFGKAAIDVKR
jgi:hypothetical protein